MWMNYLEKHAKTVLQSLEARRRGYHEFLPAHSLQGKVRWNTYNVFSSVET